MPEEEHLRPARAGEAGEIKTGIVVPDYGSGPVPLEPGEHPVLALAREAGEITGDVALFFNSTERYLQPPWPGGRPRDLTPGELAGLLQQLLRTAGNVSDAIQFMTEENPHDPGKAEQVTEGLRLIGQGCDAIRAGETLFDPPESLPAARTHQRLAAQNFPHGLPAGQALGTASQQPGAGPRPAASTARQLPPGRRPR
jgi:hypothetical protein